MDVFLLEAKDIPYGPSFIMKIANDCCIGFVGGCLFIENLLGGIHGIEVRKLTTRGIIADFLCFY